MRRTTICRFNRAALLALVVVPLACWSLRAQETTRVQVTPGGDTVRAVPVDTLAVAPVDTALRDTTQALFMEPPPAAEESYRTIFDRPRSRTTEVQDILRAYANQPYHPVRRGEFYAAGFLTERENLPWGRVLGTIAKPAIPRLTERSTAYQFEQIVRSEEHTSEL